MNTYWVSWYAHARSGPWTLHWPWWISGWRLYMSDETPDEPTVCAAVRAESEEAAKEIIIAAHDRRPENMEWRFCEQQPDDWVPFSDRFPKADWMQWPATVETAP
jgi:hypothetical protein